MSEERRQPRRASAPTRPARRPSAALPLAVAVAGAFAAACGPATIWSSTFPLRYGVVTDMVFTEGGRTERSTHVSACEIVDQRDSIAANLLFRAADDRHVFATADGGRLVLPFLQPCRWFPSEEVPDAGVRFPLRPSTASTSDPTIQRVQASEAWWFDDPERPTRMELLHSDALFDGRLPWRVDGEIAVGEGDVTRTLAAALPWLAGAEAETEARRTADAKDPSVQPWTPREEPWRFEGVLAEVWRLENGAACTGVPAAAPGPTAVGAADACFNLPVCSPGFDRACRTLVGGLVGAPSADGRSLAFTSDSARSAWIGALERSGALPADAPRWRAIWSPEVCVDGVCFPGVPAHERAFFVDYPLVYVPAGGVLVQSTGAVRQPRRAELSLEGT